MYAFVLIPSMLRFVQYALGDTAYKTYISSTKSMMGHSLGAAGLLEAAICAKVWFSQDISLPCFFFNTYLILITTS